MVVRWSGVVALAVVSATIRGHTQVLDETALRAPAPVAFGFFTPSRGLVSTTDGHLLLTTDGGRSWRLRGRPRLSEIDVVTSRSAYARRGPWLARTDDAGASWQRLRRVPGSLSFADRGHGWIDDGGAGIQGTEDGARTLHRIRVPCPENASMSRAVSRVTATLGFVACAPPGGAGNQLKRLYVTRDAGRTWRLRAREGQVPDAGYLLSILFTSDQDGVMTATRGGVEVTHDGGKSWLWVLSTEGDTAVQVLPRALLVQLAGAVLRVEDRGGHRTLLYPHSEPGPSQVSFSTARDGLGIGWDWPTMQSQIVATHDGGHTWQFRSRFPDSYSPDLLARAGRNVVYLVTISYRRSGSVLFRSHDDGRAWKRIATPEQSQFFAVSFTSARDGMLGDDAGRFFATRDGGRTWTLVHGRGEDLRTFAFLTRAHGLALSSAPDGVLYETRDGGRTWRPVAGARLRGPIGFTTLGSRHIWIEDLPACRRSICPGAIVRTADGGRTWQRIELNMLPGTPIDFPTPVTGYAPASPFSPYRTTDGGRTWTFADSVFAAR